MVRFKALKLFPTTSIVAVSIPIWFDLKRRFSVIEDFYVPVSIPIWFDLKKKLGKMFWFGGTFQFLYGSI